MGKIFHPDSPVIQLLNKVADLLVMNLLTILFSIPIVTAGAAITALYDAMWKMVEGEDHVYRSYFYTFKSNMKKSTMIWVLIFVSGILLSFLALFYAAHEMTVLTVITYFTFIIWAVTAAWVFPLQSRFENSVKGTIKNAFLCGISHFPRSIIMSAINLFPWVTMLFLTSLWVQLGLVWVLIWFSLSAHVSVMLLRKPFRKLMGKDATDLEQR